MNRDDVELVWRGPFASLPRPMDAGMVREVATAASIFAGLAALSTVPFLVGWVQLENANRAGMSVVAGLALAASAAQFALRSASPSQMERLHPNTIAPVFFMTCFLVGAAVVFVGPTLGSIAVFAVEVPLLAFILLRQPWAIAVTALSIVVYAAALAILDDPPVPVQQVINVVASAGAAGVIVGGMATRLDRARRSLADLNHNLEDRVADQVDELERTGRLRRFLSPQVADVVMSEGAEMLAPHRADIAACFVDLRGFTKFTNAVTAERVMHVLEEYYAAVGAVLDAHGATIGGFDGDGVFAYLGDPVPNNRSAAEAVVMGQEVARCLDTLTASWSDDVVGVGYGIGLAYGEATLGLVGFASRADYTPVGAVVNMAARLCSDARHGEIVVDDALRRAAALEGDLAARDDVDLKGFGVTKTYAVTH